MKQGFVKVAAATPNVKVADVSHNVEEICKMIDEAVSEKAKIIVFPELCMTGYTCGDLFTQDVLLGRAREGLQEITEYTKEKDALIFVGVPLVIESKLYNVAAAINYGKILGFTTKTFLPNYGEFYEMRQFTEGPSEPRYVLYEGEKVPFGGGILFQSLLMDDLIVAAELCEDAWAPIPPSLKAATRGATLIVNCSASTEVVGKDEYRKGLIEGASARLMAGYVYANAGEGESTTDVVFGGHSLIAENGIVLKEAKRFSNQIIYSEIDIKKLVNDRRRNTTFRMEENTSFNRVSFHVEVEKTELTRQFYNMPFVPTKADAREKRWDEILTIQALGLKKRLVHTSAKTAIVGISGGLDSTLALIVTAKAFDMLGKDHKEIIAVTMPCFGTTDRTYQNACTLTNLLGATLREISIKEAVTKHFEDIGHDITVHDVTFENSQARERTQVLMDVANQEAGLVIGTGDMSELALGWATYNGDHMSMYGVNSSIPKTLVRYLVQHYADTCDNVALSKVLIDVLDTPVSPELLPPKDGEINQKTEDLVGPYELHDFYLYYLLRFGYEPRKIFRIAKLAFKNIYSEEIILKWLKVFCRRFFAQQFKRNCLPDGPKVGSVAISPRGDWRMPSDACASAWMEDIEKIEL
ncbi:NAD(+) synthase [Lachnospiraceae bacterium OttesenSCG-928-E19]|nr:NAD(+) synthase [Lachnospiraceae bacterium OttesenSCG-928-E19]